jgi:SAM-dependent methyltransferase
MSDRDSAVSTQFAAVTAAVASVLCLSGPSIIHAAAKKDIPLTDVRPIMAALPSQVPAALKGKTDAELAAAWPGWVRSRSAAIRERLARGDEDSVVNLMLFGTSFTSAPRVVDADTVLVNGRAAGAALMDRRLDDMLAAIGRPGANERLQFVKAVVTRAGINPATAAGRAAARRHLAALRSRMLNEIDRYRRATLAAQRANDRAAEFDAFNAYYRDRGLASDTSLMANFSVDRALATLAARGAGTLDRVRRVAIVGPGLDFADKGSGDAYDFYPLQTLQPFGVVDSLLRLGLSAAGDIHVTTMDVSPRVNAHIRQAVTASRAGRPYVVQLPLERDTPQHHWIPEVRTYWQAFGDRVGSPVPALQPPATVSGVDVRAVQIRPEVVRAISAEDLNIVFERLDPLTPAEQFDLIVATNILVYYDPFEQALAMANVAKMLRPGGMFLANTAVFPTPPMVDRPYLFTRVNHDEGRSVDALFWYERR